MDTNNPYDRIKKSKIDLYKEKLNKRNVTQEWIFGNSFGKPGGGAPLRDNKGNVISGLKSVADDKIKRYDANYFSKGNNNISVINHKIFNNSNNEEITLNNPINYNNINNNIQLQNNNIYTINPKNIINNSNTKGKNTIENQKNNNIIISDENSGNNENFPNFYSKPQYFQNSPYFLILPYNTINYSPVYLFNNNYPILNNSNQTLNDINSNNNYTNYNNNNIINYFGIDSKKKEEEKSLERQEYRNELLIQINEKRRKDEERKRKMEEEDKLEDIKNQEYFKIKKLQAEEQAQKLRERINRRMQKPLYEDQRSSSNIEISKDFENFNKSLEGESPLNNNIEEIKENNENNENNILNIDDNIYGDNMLLEEENYMRKIDEDYKILNQLLIKDIDNQINYNNINEINKNNIDKENIKLVKKQNQLADYILGNNFTPPTPIKFNNKNPLFHSYSKIKSLPQEEELYNTFKNKTINLEEFFNKDKKKEENNYNGVNIKDAIQVKEAQDKIEQDYESIFKDLKYAHEYTKKYSKKDDDENLENSTTSFYSTNTGDKDNNKSKQKYITKNNASHLNSSISYSHFDQEGNENKKNNDINKEQLSDNTKIDENSGRTTGIKNISRTVLDKELINIQENKEDEEDEEDDEQNHKNKEEINSDESQKKDNNEINENNIDNNEQKNEEEYEELEEEEEVEEEVE